jgi:hypothetical protein
MASVGEHATSLYGLAMNQSIGNQSIRPASFARTSLVIVFILGMLQGCTTQVPIKGGLYQRLSNRGPVLLSTENPFLPANRLLSEELNNSAELRDFIAQRGSPTAIEVTQSLLSRTELSLIYPAENEVYRLAQRRSGWSVGEPEALSADALEKIESELALGGVSLGDPREAQKYVAAILPSTDLDEDTTRASLAHSDIGENEKINPSKLPRNHHNTGTRQAKVLILKNGGLVHSVTFPGESLSVIAAWYTGATSNTALIAKANKISTNKVVKIGQSVTIPPKLLKNRKPLSQAFLRSALR